MGDEVVRDNRDSKDHPYNITMERSQVSVFVTTTLDYKVPRGTIQKYTEQMQGIVDGITHYDAVDTRKTVRPTATKEYRTAKEEWEKELRKVRELAWEEEVDVRRKLREKGRDDHGEDSLQ